MSGQEARSAATTPSRLLVLATIELPTDRDWTRGQMERDVRNALTDYGYFVVRADVEEIEVAVVLRCPECGVPLELGHDCLADPEPPSSRDLRG